MHKSELSAVRYVGIQHEVPEVATTTEIANVFTVVVVVVGGIGNHGKDAERTPLKLIPRVVLAA